MNHHRHRQMPYSELYKPLLNLLIKTEATLSACMRYSFVFLLPEDSIELESPLLGGDLGVGKSVIREIFTEISRPRNPPLTPPQRGIICWFNRLRLNLNILQFS